ncbi:hypothetical protein [Oribacterium sp. FC2011]|uniref:hypothetical protein n=1 Tax=Oribacterium sp. FC2011 TaxID=1408311 RepID=UPI0004E1215B|nr:hypothetical protein [Oribacterium sp. FC2011]
MFEILKSVERSYSLGSTLILLATIWAGLAVLSYKNKRTIYFYIELFFMCFLYLMSLVLLINAVFYEPLWVLLKLIGHTLLIAIALIVIRYAPLHHNKNI